MPTRTAHNPGASENLSELVASKPGLSYRYASFQGNDVATTRSETFDPLFLLNSSLISHAIRARFEPSDASGRVYVAYSF
jgi:hypothetical protein